MRILTAMMCVLLAACTSDNKALIMKHRLACEAVYNNNGYLICNNKNGPGYIVWDSERIVGQFDSNSLSQVKSDVDSGTVQKYTNFYEYRLGKQLSATPAQVKELWKLKIYSVFEYESQSNAMSPRPKDVEEFLLYKRRAVEKAALEKTAQEKIATERAAAERIRTKNVASANIAASFDKTGLIDLKNEGTTRGSCVGVGKHLQISTVYLYNKMIQTPAEGQDGLWKTHREANKITELGQSAKYLSEVLSDGATNHVPPSQMMDYTKQTFEGFRRANDTLYNPWIAINAWDFCRNILRF
jgi:hypothetical protein